VRVLPLLYSGWRVQTGVILTCITFESAFCLLRTTSLTAASPRFLVHLSGNYLPTPQAKMISLGCQRGFSGGWLTSGLGMCFSGKVLHAQSSHICRIASPDSSAMINSTSATPMLDSPSVGTCSKVLGLGTIAWPEGRKQLSVYLSRDQSAV